MFFCSVYFCLCFIVLGVGSGVSGSGVRDEGPSRHRRQIVNVFKAHRLLYHSTLGLRVIKKKKGSDASSNAEKLAPKETRKQLSPKRENNRKMRVKRSLFCVFSLRRGVR